MLSIKVSFDPARGEEMELPSDRFMVGEPRWLLMFRKNVPRRSLCGVQRS
jgi:hypothetical protein